MNKKVILGILAGFLLGMFLQSSSAYEIYDMHYRGGSVAYAVKGTNDAHYKVYDFDYWECDKICQWANKGDFEERYKRHRAVDWTLHSTNKRYSVTSGRDSGDAFYYDYYSLENKPSSSWRYKESYDKNWHGSGNGRNYYYEPRYEYGSKTWDWRY